VTAALGASGGGWLGPADVDEVLAAIGVRRASAKGGGSVEVVVGVVQDPLFGPLVTFALGGPIAKLIGDPAYRVLPITDVDARDLVRSVRGGDLLVGIEALEDLVQRVGRLAGVVPEIVELELDPVIASADGAGVAGARVRVHPAPASPDVYVRRLNQ
jgi:hypothetical protein